MNENEQTVAELSAKTETGLREMKQTHQQQAADAVQLVVGSLRQRVDDNHQGIESLSTYLNHVADHSSLKQISQKADLKTLEETLGKLISRVVELENNTQKTQSSQNGSTRTRTSRLGALLCHV